MQYNPSPNGCTNMTFTIGSAKELITSHSGLAPLGRMLAGLGLDELDKTVTSSAANPDIPNRDVVVSLVGMLALGQSAFTDIEQFREDAFFKEAMGVSVVPSEGSTRARIQSSEGRFDAIIRNASVAAVAAGQPTAISINGRDFMPVDADVSILDNSGSSKEGVLRTYHTGIDGFAPMFAYIGAEGFMLHQELRPGSQHCQLGTPEFLAESIRMGRAVSAGTRLLFRLDAGNDAAVNIREMDGLCDYIIKRNLRHESTEEWLAIAKTSGAVVSPREGKTVWIGSVRRMIEVKAIKDKNISTFRHEVRVVFEVTERSITAKGERLLLPSIEVNSWNTSLEDVSELEIIALYHDHGTSEQFHSEFKSDMGVERLPSAKFAVNRTVMVAAMLAYNLLRRLGKEMLKVMPVPGVERRRLRTVIHEFMYLAAKVVSKARRIFLKFSRDYQWTFQFGEIYARC